MQHATIGVEPLGFLDKVKKWRYLEKTGVREYVYKRNPTNQKAYVSTKKEHKQIEAINRGRGWRSGEYTCLPPMWLGCDRHMWVEFVVGSRPCSEGFFLPPQKPTFPNSNSIWNLRATGLSVEKLFGVNLVKQGRFYLFF